ncbi:MAG: hypothetical protein EHM35_00345 [Planctomycetaceae bacterium]|nr:MAG: hypothetical protein EHM35_00345 [Planctomycetaceae bacterium]
MTTPAKRWPKNAEASRCEALAAAMTIEHLGSKAREALGRGNRDLVLVYLSDMQRAANEIKVSMLLAKEGRAVE